MEIAIGSDHAGYALKEKIKAYLDELKYKHTDFGAPSSESVDYPDIAVQVARFTAESKEVTGILICGSGIGMSIVANKVTGIRAALCTTVEAARLARRHNNANVLALGARMTSPELALKIVLNFLNTPPDPEIRHQRRIQKIHELTDR